MSQPTDPVQQPSAPHPQQEASYPTGQAAQAETAQPAGTGERPAPQAPAFGASAGSPAAAPYQAPGQSGATGAQGTATGAGGPTTAAGASPAAGRSTEPNFFQALFDFKFEHFITVRFAPVLYIVAIIVSLLVWLGQIIVALLFGAIIGSMSAGFYDEPSFNAIPLVIALLLGWIPAVISLIFMRLGIEFSVATVRTAENTTKLAKAAAR